MPHSVARALCSTLLIFIAGSNIGFTGRGFWSMALGRKCAKGLGGRGYLLERLLWMLQAEEEV